MTYNNYLNRNHTLNVLIAVLSLMIVGMVLIGKAHSVSASVANQVSTELSRAQIVSSYENIQVQGLSGASNTEEADWTFVNNNTQSVRVTWTIQCRSKKVSGLKVIPAGESVIFTEIPGRMTYSVEIIYISRGVVNYATVSEREIVRSLAPLNLALLERSGIQIPRYNNYRKQTQAAPQIQSEPVPQHQTESGPAPSCPMNIEETQDTKDEPVERRLIALNR